MLWESDGMERKEVSHKYNAMESFPNTTGYPVGT